MIHNLDINDFLNNYWQKKPLLIRAAFPNYQSPITAEELAGLACEDFVESRIITEQKASPKWLLENGPFSESHFCNLSKSHWTILIQGLNKIFPEFDDLLHEFDFIPNWRIDDLMASYAAPEGSVGPHIDQYDVFLLQATGRRKWMISEQPITDDDYIPDSPLKIIKNFKTESEWILEAGDVLYLPPNVAHYGIGLENCMTFSIGFRAPSHAELLSAYVDDHINELSDSLRFKDPLLSTDNRAGEISEKAINSIQEILLSQFSDKEKIADWFGEYITDYLNDFENNINKNISVDKFIAEFKKSGALRKPASIRANYYAHNESQLAFFINGNKQQKYSNMNKIIKLYCDQHIINYEEIIIELSDNDTVKFLSELYNDGYIEFIDE